MPERLSINASICNQYCEANCSCFNVLALLQSTHANDVTILATDFAVDNACNYQHDYPFLVLFRTYCGQTFS